MLGPIVNAAAVAVGGVAGGSMGHRLPARVREGLPAVFGLVAMGIGVALTVKAEHFAPIVLALVLGTLIGEWMDLQARTHRAARSIQGWFPQVKPGEGEDEEIERVAAEYSSLIVLFCASSTGLVGALQEGLTGDGSLLIAKSILDFFTAIVFAVNVGSTVAFLGLPLLLVQGGIMLGASHLAAHFSHAVILDTCACGGLILLGTGLRILDIKPLHVINMLPALLLVAPISALMTWLHP
jgi:uncharacterized protein